MLVSCAGRAATDEEDAPAASAKGQLLKRRGEAALRNSGLGYTIVRPGPLLEEPGGYRALVFDQVCFGGSWKLSCSGIPRRNSREGF